MNFNKRHEPESGLKRDNNVVVTSHVQFVTCICVVLPSLHAVESFKIRS